MEDGAGTGDEAELGRSKSRLDVGSRVLPEGWEHPGGPGVCRGG